MKLFYVLIVLALFAAAYGGVIKSCGGTATMDVNKVNVTACTSKTDRCIFKKHTNVGITLPFTPMRTLPKLQAKAYGIIYSVPVPFTLPNGNACLKSGLTCPLQPNTEYAYELTLPILPSYPSISLDVKILLEDDRKKQVVCVIFPVHITS